MLHLLLVTIAVLILDFSDHGSHAARIGLILCGSAIVMVTYGMFVYSRRIGLLASGQAYGYVDWVGPLMLGASVLVWHHCSLRLLDSRRNRKPYYSEGQGRRQL